MKNVWITLYEINLVLCFSLDKYPFAPQVAHSSLLWLKENKNFVYHMDTSLGPLITDGINPVF